MGIGAAAGVSLAATALAAGVSAYGAVQSANAQSSAAKYQSQVAANNATVAGQNATLATQQADAKAQADYRSGAQRLGAQRAAMGADGGTLNSGSAEDVQKATAESTQMGVSNDTYQGSLQAYGLRTQQSNFTAESGLDQMTASNATTAGDIGAAGSILGGASQFASKWNSYSSTTASATPAATTSGTNYDASSYS